MWKFYLTDLFTGVEYEVSEPIGFDALELTLRRSEKYTGLEFLFGDQLTFIDIGAEVLRAAYQRHGINAKVTIEISDTSCSFSYQGVILFNSYKETHHCEDCLQGEITVTIEQSGFTQKFKNRIDIPVDLDADTGIDGNTITALPSQLSLHSKEILFEAKYKINDLLKDLEGGYGPIYLTPPFQIKQTDVEGAAEPIDYFGQYQRPFLYSGFEFISGITERKVKVKMRLKFSVEVAGYIDFFHVAITRRSVQEAQVKQEIKLNEAQDLPLNAVNPFDILFDQELIFGKDESLFIEIFIDPEPVPASIKIKFDEVLSYLSLSENSIVPESTAKVYFVEDAFQTIAQSITGEPDSFRSDFFSRDQEGEGAYLTITNGLNIRNMRDKDNLLFPVSCSFVQLYDAFDAIYCLGMRIEKAGEVDPATGAVVHKEYVRVEPRSYFYDREAAPGIEPFVFVPEVTRSISLEHIYNEIEIGYSKWETEGVNGIDEFNTKRNYYIPVTNQKKKLSLLCNAITGGYSIEMTRRQQFKQTPTKDFSTDNDLFIISANRIDMPWAIEGTYLKGTAAERDELFTGIENLLSPHSSYNLRLSPVRMLCNWWPYIQVSLYKNDSDSIQFQSGTGNYQMRSSAKQEAHTRDTGILAENMDLSPTSIKSPYREALFSPEDLEYTVPMSMQEFVALKETAIYTFLHSCNSDTFIGSYIKEVKFRPEKEGWFAEMQMIRK